MKPPIRVVGAVIVRDGKILCARRGPGSMAGLWEFPGGKVEPGESPEAALRREIREELQAEITVGDEVTTTRHGFVVLTTYLCETTDEPHPVEHDELRWLAPDELATLEWAPADLPTVALLSSSPS